MDENLRYKNTSWFFPSEKIKKRWEEACFNKELYWGDFPKDRELTIPQWGIFGFQKHGKPVLAPTKDKWDCGVFGGGVHNGSIIVKDDIFYYIYRGEFPIEPNNPYGIKYACNIGIATSKDGINFEKLYDITPIFNDEEDKKYSYEDVCVVEKEGTYYMFVNRWNWNNVHDTNENGVFLAISKDLLHWKKQGIVFPSTKFMCRNACVLQNLNNQAVKVNGTYRMFMSTMRYCLTATSEDLINWTVSEIEKRWPGGECCFALADYDKNNPNNVILFTGGRHTGHYYAIGEVLFTKDNLTEYKDFSMKPVLFSQPQYPWENGLDIAGQIPVSFFRDTIFFNGLTLKSDILYLYYGGSEYYTCLATKRVEK